MADWWPNLRSAFESWTGVQLRDAMHPMVERLVAKLSDARGTTVPGLVGLAQRDPVARQELIDEITVGTTWFLREREGLVELASQLAQAGPEKREVLVWSIGCSSGEEPYSLAMLLSSAGLRPRVLATDVNRKALARALDARYRVEALADLPGAWRKRYFEPARQGFARVSAEIRALVRFEIHNVATAKDPPLGWRRFDAIICRNVLMYFSQERAVRIVDQIVRHCRGGGLIMLGSAERPVLWPQVEEEGADSPVYEVDPHRRIRMRRPTLQQVVDLALEEPSSDKSTEQIRHHLQLANQLARGGRTSDALSRLTALAHEHPNNAEVQVELGLAYKRAGQIEEAARALRAARAQSGSGWLPCYQLGTCLEQLGEKSEAKRAWRQTLDRLAAGAQPGRAFDSDDLIAMAPTVKRLCEAKLGRDRGSDSR